MSKTMARAGAMKWKQSAIKMLVGAAAGLGASAAVMALAGAPLLDAMGPSRLALAAVGFVYLLIAVFVGLGVAVPRAGAKLLNVGDAEELVEDRRGMLRSVTVMGALGLVLILLALARGGDFAGPVPAGVAVAALVALIVVGGIATWRWQGEYDELNRQLGLEGSFWAFCLSWLILTLWAVADFLDLGLRLTPVDVVTTLAAAMLAGSFVAIGRRGMMTR